MANLTTPESCVFLLLLLCIISISYIAPRSYALKIKLIHRDSPQSPLYRPNLTDSERIKERNRISLARVEWLANRGKAGHRSNGNATAPPPHDRNDFIMRPPLMSESGIYVIEMGLGVFEDNDQYFQTEYLIFDTGSDLAWTQCEGCNPCFHQTYDYYPASRSKSYSEIPCSDCASVGGRCNGDRCEFARRYADGAFVRAVAAHETLVFGNDLGQFVGLENIVFGCGYSMTDFSEGDREDNRISGILGMSYGALSLVKQATVETHGRFSYCLIPPKKEAKARTPMVLRMGSDVKVIPGMKATPMPSVPEGPHTAYYLNLEGISVANKRLNIPPDVFRVKGDHSGGCVIDTGTSVTLLATEAFKVFEQELTNHVLRRNKHLKRIGPELGYEICFERIAPPSKVRLPWVKFHFENNADFIIKYEGGFYIGFTPADKPMVCSTIVESTEKYRKITLLGGEQQVNHQIIYDTVNQQLMFGEDNCAEHN